MTPSEPPLPAPDEGRSAQILETALRLFLRFGFKKTSMDDVAQSLDLSRQALYSHFRSKDELFRRALLHALTSSLRDGQAELARSDLSLRMRLERAYDEWMGRYIGLGSDPVELHTATSELGADLMEAAERALRSSVTRAIEDHGMPKGLVRRCISPEQVADTVALVARGAKHSAHTREEFRNQLGSSLEVLLAEFESC